MSASGWGERLRAVRLKPLLLGAAVLAALGAAAAAASYVLEPTRYPVLHVRFSGPFKHVTREELVAAVGDSVRGNFFRVDLAGVRARIEALPWVYRATVHRRWPQAVEIDFSEQTFVAQWGEQAWLNGDANAVRLPARPDVPRGLPILTGPEGTQAQVLNAYQRFGKSLAPLDLRIVALDLSPRRTWSVRLDNGLPLLLGREQADARLARFIEVYAQAVADKVARIKQVDLRYSNGFSVEWRSAS